MSDLNKISLNGTEYTVVDTELDGLSSDIDEIRADLSDKMDGVDSFIVPSDLVVNSPLLYFGTVGNTIQQRTSLSTGMSIKYNVTNIKKVLVTGYSWVLSYDYSLYFFVDSEDKIISRYEVNSVNVKDLEVSVPTNAVFIIVNGSSETTRNAPNLKILDYVNTNFEDCYNSASKNLRDLVSIKVDGLEGYTSKKTTITEGSLWVNNSSTPFDTGVMASAIVDGVEKVKITGFGWQSSYGYYLYAFYDSNNQVVSKVTNDSTTVTDLEVSVPSGAYELRVNGRIVNSEPVVGIKLYGTITDFEECYEAVSVSSTQPKKIIALGDSITALGTGARGWLKYFSELIDCTIIANTAVNSAVLRDKSNTVYDGNPSESAQANNVLGNQVQKIINNEYEAPDVIIIAIGTNGGINISEQDIADAYYDSSNNLINLENVDRTTYAGAFRYAFDTLHDLYPNALIVWCTPIMGFQKTRSAQNAIAWAESLKIATEFIGQIYIDTIRCGINGINENQGTSGEYLIDGLHPNEAGAKKIGYYNAIKLKPFLT